MGRKIYSESTLCLKKSCFRKKAIMLLQVVTEKFPLRREEKKIIWTKKNHSHHPPPPLFFKVEWMVPKRFYANI